MNWISVKPGSIRRYAWLVLCASLLAACSDRPRLPALDSDSTILAFGNSLTYGTGAGEQQGYPAVLQQLTGMTVINAGVPGEISARGRQRLPALLDKHRPGLLILCHGGNDILRRMSRKTLQQNIEAMIDMAREREITVILLGVPDFSLFLSAADEYDAVAETTGTAYMRELLSSILKQPSLKSDQIHPNAQGYRRMAEAVHQFMLDTGLLTHD